MLKPGGRFAAVVFSAVERNPFRAAPQAIASRLAGKQFPESGPGQWALNDPTTPRDAFQQAGFRDVDVRPVPFVYRFSSLANALRNLEEAQRSRGSYRVSPIATDESSIRSLIDV